MEVRRKAPGQPDEIFGRLVAGLPAVGGPIYPDFVTYSYIAHFVEVGVEANKGRADSRVTSSLRVRETGYRISA